MLITNKDIFPIVLFSLILVGNMTAQPSEEITLESLLEEMINREVIASFPSPKYSTLQFSSYDRASVKPTDQSWFANWDRTMFLREEQNNGRREFVMFEDESPGAVVRFWMTFGGPGAGEGTLRFYFDGESEPVIEGNAMEVLSGGFLTGEPLSASVSDLSDYKVRGHNLYLPLPYSDKLKITYESDHIAENGAKGGSEDVYYNINYRSYTTGTRVKSFSDEELQHAKPVVEKVQQKLAEKDKSEDLKNIDLKELSLETEIQPGKSFTKTIKGPAAIRKISAVISAENEKQALRSTVLELSFDGERTVWVPMGDFFGTGYQYRKSDTWYTTVKENHEMEAFWLMPFKESTEITIHNLGEQSVHLENSTVSYSDWKWEEGNMHFGATWQQYSKIYTGEQKNMEGKGDPFDINYTHLNGSGVYVGDVLTLFNTAYDWWGEGDEKVYVDGEDFPSHFGTGTEDYYGYAWVRPEVFINHPFISQPDGSGNITPGFTINIRFRSLDAIPFTSELKLDMELWHWTSTVIDYSPTTFFYIKPGSKIQIEPDMEDVQRAVTLKREQLISPWVENDRIDGQNLIIESFSGGKIRFQYLTDPELTGNKHLWWHEAKPGDTLKTYFKMREAGKFVLTGNFTTAPDFGTVEIMVNGKKMMEPVQAFSEHLETKRYELGEFELKSGLNEVTFKILEFSPDGENAFVGLDFIDFKKSSSSYGAKEND